MNVRRPTLSVSLPLALAIAVWLPVAFGSISTFRVRFDQIRPGMSKQHVYDLIGPPSPVTVSVFDWEAHAVIWSEEEGKAVRREFGPQWKVYWLRPGQPSECWVSGSGVGWIGFDTSGAVTTTVWYDRSRPLAACFEEYFGFLF
jgi:hypothetical protein